MPRKRSAIVSKFLFLLIPFMLSACVTSGEQNWHRVNVKAEEYLIVNGDCKADSYKAIPQSPLGNSCGAGIVINNNTKDGADKVSEVDNPAMERCLNQQERREWKITRARKDVYEGCMLKKGWIRNAD